MVQALDCSAKIKGISKLKTNFKLKLLLFCGTE